VGPVEGRVAGADVAGADVSGAVAAGDGVGLVAAQAASSVLTVTTSATESLDRSRVRRRMFTAGSSSCEAAPHQSNEVGMVGQARTESGRTTRRVAVQGCVANLSESRMACSAN
jgi:hypothetical protein